MSDKFILNVDDDWKRQAQEEKRRLAEQEAKQKEAAAAAKVSAPAAAEGVGAEAAEEAGQEASPFAGLVHTLLTQTLVYLGAGSRQGMPVNMDAARSAIDMLGVLDDKTRGNLSDLEQKILDTALYQARNQFIAIASQMIGP